MKRFYSQAAMTLLASLLLLACDNKKKDYPTDYVGFERSTQTYYYNPANQEETLEVKVIAVDKKKEAKTTIVLSPKKAIRGQVIQISCTPLWEGGQTSKLAIELMPK